MMRFAAALTLFFSQSAFAIDYGVDVSYPIHHVNVSTNYAWLPHNLDPSLPTPPEYEGMVVQPLGDKQTMYNNLIDGCRQFYEASGKAERCDDSEADRVQMSLRQPQGMVNYTELGFTKIRAPDSVMKLLLEFWEANKDKAKRENWPAGNTYVNHWESPSEMIGVEDKSLKHGGFVLKQHIWNAARDTIQEWTGQQLAECSLYGIRIYKEGAVLATHVDRLPLVSSAIINVDQDLDEPWPLEVIGHDGKAHNVTMLPGDLVLYESHSILHGRPFPLKGRFMANVFIHFEPIGCTGCDIIDGTSELPPYVIPGSLEESNWRARNPDGYTIMQSERVSPGATEAHRAASEQNLDTLQLVVGAHEEVVNAMDANGWTPLHEGVRSGNIDIVKFLVEKGSDVNARTQGGVGGSALWWGINRHGKENEVVKFLESLGAKNIPPEREEKEL